MQSKTQKRKYQYQRRKSSRKQGGKGKSPKSPKSPKKFRCCMCRAKVSKNETLETTRCRVKGPYYRHPICPDCWWGTDSKPGFAAEEGTHECPGCKKGVPPIRRTPPKSPPITIDISDSP